MLIRFFVQQLLQQAPQVALAPPHANPYLALPVVALVVA
jgi:hypothetical protein